MVVWRICFVQAPKCIRVLLQGVVHVLARRCHGAFLLARAIARSRNSCMHRHPAVLLQNSHHVRVIGQVAIQPLRLPAAKILLSIRPYVFSSFFKWKRRSFYIIYVYNIYIYINIFLLLFFCEIGDLLH